METARPRMSGGNATTDVVVFPPMGRLSPGPALKRPVRAASRLLRGLAAHARCTSGGPPAGAELEQAGVRAGRGVKRLCPRPRGAPGWPAAPGGGGRGTAGCARPRASATDGRRSRE
ncbi:hypothetical protein NDU88_000595 [Pleurodeles waltl]|uniref:Uncharacterized protein n=1 Tax=Pleurodeles waltl TaxID=8319 RepID=A0AAV7MQA0_PLEWA|nr:hypothetical protein NDU88_000595 [Pleurodeles waltl]